VRVEGDPVDDRGHEPRVWEDGTPLAEGQVVPIPILAIVGEVGQFIYGFSEWTHVIRQGCVEVAGRFE
jgi:hypothetical protein